MTERDSCVRVLYLLFFLLGFLHSAYAANSGDPLVFEVFASDTAAVPMGKPAPFEFAASDLDLDGDVDLVVNWHLHGIELYLNQDNRKFSRIGREESGLYHQGNVVLYATSKDIITAAESSPGIYVWHDPLIIGNWNIYISPNDDSDVAVEFTLRSNEIIKEFVGVARHEISRNSELETREDAWASFRLDVTSQPRHITFKTKAIGSNIRLSKKSPLPFFLGGTLVEDAGDRVSLRMADPHAMAWVNVIATKHPDLFVVRGGNRGRLNPPFEAKRNRLFVATGDAGTQFQLESDSLIPADYGRGRGVAWVDINGDGRNELYLGNKTSSNALLVFDEASGTYQDLASVFGLAMPCGDAFTWLDLNEDGYDDLLFMTCYGSVAVAINKRGREFIIRNAEDFGIVLGPVEQHKGLFDSTTINSFDFDTDGHLDVFVSGIGKQHMLQVFRSTGGKFVDATKELGLDGVVAGSSIATDVDSDGYIDLLVSGGKGLQVYRNDEGSSFTRTDIVISRAEEASSPALESMAVADFDGDAVKDIIIGTRGHWMILRNRVAPAGKMKQLMLNKQTVFEPVGTVARAHYQSGRILAQRYGSAELNGLSQFLFPLTFIATEGDKIEHFTLASPGSTEVETVSLTDERVIHLN